MESPQYNSISLFGGEELLGSLYPATKPKLDVGASDGWGEGLLSSTPTEPLSPTSDYQGSSPFGSQWLDTRVDLLDYLAGSELEGLQHEELYTIPSVEEEDPAARAVQVLKSIAEDQTALIQQDALQASPVLSPVHHAEPMSPVSPGEQVPADLLDLFAESLDESLVDSALDPSSILAPMSPEDIDDILSSGPCSPDVSMDSGVLSQYCSVSVESDASMDGDARGVQSVEVGEELMLLLQQVHTAPSPPVIISVDSRFTATDTSPAHSPQYSASPALSPQYPSPAPSPEPAPTRYRSKPYERPRKPGSSKGLPREVIQEERRLRKKQQNKDAAIRYRQKKKAEQSTIDEECDLLEDRNRVLHDKVDSMTKEIKYLKDLLVEVYAAKGLKLPISAS